MVIGCVKEIKNNENRVGLIPDGVKKLVKAGNKVLIEKSAGVGSGFSDIEYKKAGAQIVSKASDVWKKSEMIVKIKEPLKQEYKFLRKGLILFTYLHLAAEKDLTKALLAGGTTGIAYETVELSNGALPLLFPMSEVAGRLATQVGVHYLEKTHGGRGILIGGVTGVNPGNVTIIGTGTVGLNALQMAYGLGANITLFGIDNKKLAAIKKQYPKIKTAISNKANIEKVLPKTDLLVGAVLITGAKAPRILTKKMISLMPEGSVFVDVSIDQGGISETSKPTSHSNPIFVVNGVIHYCVTNMPGAVARTSTMAITAATLPYVLTLAKKGFAKAVKADKALAKGVNTCCGKLTNKPVADAFGMKFSKLVL